MLARNPRVLATALILSFLGQFVHSASSGGFSFADSCVNGCAGDSGCGTNNPKCMCKSAQGDLMETILVCMFWHCGDQLRDANTTFLSPFQVECDSIGKPIPQSDINAAQKAASTLVSKLGPAPTYTTESPQSTTQPQSTPTTQPKTTKEITRATTTKHTTSPADTAQTSTRPPSDSPTTTPNPASSSSSSSSPSPQSPSTTADAPNTDPTDSSPFATPRGGASRTVGSLVLAALPLALLLF